MKLATLWPGVTHKECCHQMENYETELRLVDAAQRLEVHLKRVPLEVGLVRDELNFRNRMQQSH